MIISGKLIPKYIIGLICILIAICIFVPTVFIPYISNKDALTADINKANSQLAIYENNLKNIDNMSKRVDALKKEWEKIETEMFITGEYIVNDISDMMKSIGVDPGNIVVSDESEVMPAASSSTGDPMYSVTVNMNFTASQEDLISVLKYFEKKSDGTYFVSNLALTTVKESEGSGAEAVSEGDLVATMNFTGFYFRDVPSSVTTPDTTTPTTAG